MKASSLTAETLLLETHLKQLRLPTFVSNHAKCASEAAQANLDYQRYLLALAEQEVAQREQNQQTTRIKQAHLPACKELADFDFSALPKALKPRILELARDRKSVV